MIMSIEKMRAHGAVQEGELSTSVAEAAVAGDAFGAVVSFSGVVRNHDEGRGVKLLKYSAHPSASEVLAEIAEEIVREYAEMEQPVQVWVEHRVGQLAIGDAALVAAVAGAHRREAFAACAELVERVKERIPVWKEQVFDDGSSEWVNSA